MPFLSTFGGASSKNFAMVRAPLNPLYCIDYLIIGGGGGGGGMGGGGAGGFLEGNTILTRGINYSVVVGAGGLCQSSGYSKWI